MPKISKIRVAQTRPGEPKPPKEALDKYRCTRCGKIYVRQRGNFAGSQSPLFRENGGYLPVCRRCVDDLFSHYKQALESDKDAMRRMCMKFDIYWSEDIYGMVKKVNTSNSRVSSYISKTYLNAYIGRTYDDTLDEERAVMGMMATSGEDESGAAANEGRLPSKRMVEFWGSGFAPGFYFDLEARYAKWTKSVAMPIDRATEALYKQICILEATINRNTALGKPIEQSVNALNNLLGSANLKPVQKKQDEALDAPFDNLPFGVGIKMCEDTEPIPKPDPRFDDVDGVRKYISVWFLGHLCKMLGIRNTYCQLYENEMARLRVERQVNEDEDDEGAFNYIFGDEPGGDAS